MATSSQRLAAIYVRISRDKTGGGLGVQRQWDDCNGLAERLGVRVINAPDEFSDNDISAYSGKSRPGYRRLLAAIEGGRVETVLTWHTDRLHRSPVELEQWIIACEPRAVEVHTVKAGPIDLATPSGRMIARQLGAVARYESEHRAERVAAKMDEIARQGGFMGGVRPFGFTRNGLELVQDEAELIAEATRLILRGGSLRSAVAMFNDSGHRTSKAALAWTPIAVRDVLMRARNSGKLVHRGVVVGDAKWPGIVSEDEWRGVRTVLTNPKRRTSPGNQPRWLGSGLYRCGVCGGPMVVGTTGQHRNPSYTCRSYRERAGTRHVSRAAPALDRFVSDVLIERLSRPDAVDLFARPTVPPEELDAILAKLGVIATDRIELGARLGRGEITMDMLDAANVGLAQRQATLQATLDSAVASSPVTKLVQAPDVRTAWNGLALETKRAILDELLVVTVNHAPRGRRPDGTYFDPASVDVTGWRTP